jgi:ATP-binding cassette subfamily F protein uup
LFEPKQIQSPVSSFSGGEKNRLLLAKLFLKPANILVLDEPTNDLDVDTLELLEELLINFTGTVLLVSHDREFLNNIVTSCLAFEGQGKVREYVGGYDDWLLQRDLPEKKAKSSSLKNSSAQKLTSTANATTTAETSPTVKKLSYNEQRELKQLPRKLEKLEEAIEAIQAKFSDADFYQRDPDSISKLQADLSQLETDLEQAYERWEALES